MYIFVKQLHVFFHPSGTYPSFVDLIKMMAEEIQIVSAVSFKAQGWIPFGQADLLFLNILGCYRIISAAIWLYDCLQFFF